MESTMKYQAKLLIIIVIESQLCLALQNFRKPSDTCTVDVAENELSEGDYSRYIQERTEQAISDSILYSTIICTSSSTIIAGGEKGAMAYTSDGGISWNQVQTGSVNTIRRMSFLNTLTGVAIGDSGLVLLTSNGGRAWSYQPYANRVDLFGVSYADQQRIYAVGRRGTILRSINAGKTWESLNSGAYFSLRSIKNLGSTIAVAVGVEGTIVRTSDGGNSWRHSFSGTLNDLNDASFADGDIGIAVGNSGTVVRTADGGISWGPIQHPFSADFTSVAFADANVAVVTASNGLTIRTTNGGMEWELVRDSSTVHFFGVSFANPLVGFIAGDLGIILHTNDGGAHWSTVERYVVQTAPELRDDKNQTLKTKIEPASKKGIGSNTVILTPKIVDSKEKETPPLDIQMGLAKVPTPRWKPFDLPTMMVQIPSGVAGGFVMGGAGLLLGSALDGGRSLLGSVLLGGLGAFFGIPAGVCVGGNWMGGNGTYIGTLFYGYGIFLCGGLIASAAPPLGVIVMILSPALGYQLSATPVYQSDNLSFLGAKNTMPGASPHSATTLDLRVNVLSISF